MRYICRLTLFALLACFAGQIPAMAGWADRRQGTALVDFFPPRVTGSLETCFIPLQDAKGRLFVGSEKLLVYDGARWTQHPIPGSYFVSALSFGPDGRLWAGATNELGYFTENVRGDFIFTSLRNKLPAGHGDIERVWACAVVGETTYFVCHKMILAWDGQRFNVWDFPGETRLFPVRLGNELWFTHLETGLYRLNAQGPELVHRPLELPAKAAFWLERDTQGLIVGCRLGFFRVGHPDQPICSPEIADYLNSHNMTGAVRLADGHYVISTLDGGLLITTADLRLLRTLRIENGLPTNEAFGLYIDREGQVWVSTSHSGVYRLNPSASASLFQGWVNSDHTTRTAVTHLKETAGGITALSDAGVYLLQSNEQGVDQFSPIPSLRGNYSDMLEIDSGMMLAGFAAIKLFSQGELQNVYLNPAQDNFRLFRSNRDPLTVAACSTSGPLLLHPKPDGTWDIEKFAVLTDTPDECYLDPHDNFWINSASKGLTFVSADGKTVRAVNADLLKPSDGLNFTVVTGRGDRVYFFTGADGYLTEAPGVSLRRLRHYPTLRAFHSTVSSDGSRLYVVFERRRDATTPVYGVGYLHLGGNGDSTDWVELDVPKFSTVGLPRTLLVTNEDGADALWIGGSDGLIRIKPDELLVVRAPVRPWLSYSDLATPDRTIASNAELNFGKHRLLLQTGSTQLDQRKDLWFQTRLVHDDAPTDWSQSSPRSSFEFINLIDGSYTFEARAINPAGLISETASFGFRVLPPWYRTLWAYGGYIVTGGLGFYGLAYLRERRIRRRNQQLEQIVRERTSELERANAAKDDFLAGISHEIRNPMNGVVGLASAIDTSQFDPETRRRVGYLRHCATHLSSLLEDILDFSRLQSDAVELDSQPFDVHELVESIVAITATESQHAGLPVEVAVSPAVPRRLIGDPARLRQVLINFVLNALKYAGKGTVCLTVWARIIGPGRSEVTFAVSDEGPGISAEEQTKLFTRFVRGSVAKERRVAGTGLGLSVCKLIAERMSGRVWVESEPGQGATFHIAATFTTAPEPAKVPLSDVAAPHALVVDDEAYNRDALTALLGQLGFRVSQAADGAAALSAAFTSGPAVVFLDFDLPDMSGLEVARQLRTNPNSPPDLLIIATTAYTSPTKRAEALAAGMNSFLTKPISLEKVRSALTSATLATRATSPLHAPGRDSQQDPLASLRLLASRKAVTLTAELDLYLRELDMETGELTAAVERRDGPIAARAAHRLTGRFAFVWAEMEEQLARSIEAAVTNEDWDHVDTLLHELPPLLDGFRARLVTLAD